eukprot:TRINITY_DN10953_c0_g1_i1.p2 TRINITY_DN10953_c0_g1~~TRINITY_DN10953_c0_g1_i1.p2  ORF type:complete len:278 (+),score=112.40 TRINITY_DN10953_c0_g1_i1:111-836(+)
MEDDEDQWQVKMYDGESKTEQDKMQEDAPAQKLDLNQEEKTLKPNTESNQNTSKDEIKNESKEKEEEREDEKEEEEESKEEKQTKPESSKKTKKPPRRKRDMLSGLSSSTNFSLGSGPSKRRTFNSVIAGVTTEEEKHEQHFAERRKAKAEEQKLSQSKINRIVDDSLKADRTLMLFNRKQFDSEMTEQIRKRKVKRDEPSPFRYGSETLGESTRKNKRVKRQERYPALLADLLAKVEQSA